MLLQFGSRETLYCEPMLLGAKGSLDQFNDSCYRLPNKFCNRCIVHDWLWRIRIWNLAIAEQQDIGEQLAVVSHGEAMGARAWRTLHPIEYLNEW